MQDDLDYRPPRKRLSLSVKLALVGAGVAAGALGATAVGAGALTGSGSTPALAAPSSDSSTGGTAPRGDGDHRGAGGHAGEKALSASLTATLKAAALKAVPGGTVDRVESDSGDATYEAHMTKSDGTKVTVKFDKNLKVTAVEAGMGK